MSTSPVYSAVTNRVPVRRDIPAAGTAPTLARIVFLAGRVESSAFERAVGRPILNLPLDASSDLASVWHREVVALLRGREDETEVVVVAGRDALPRWPDVAATYRLSTVAEPLAYRGTAGVLRDVTADLHPDAYVLVVTANQLPLVGLRDVVAALTSVDAAGGRPDAVVVDHPDGSPSGYMLVRIGTLEAVPAVGFVDFKEQFLSRLPAGGADVRVVTSAKAFGLAVRDDVTYLEAVRRRAAGLADADPFAEAWQRCFGIVEAGAVVHEGARVHNAVVLRGGSVGAGAAVTCGVVCPGARVPPGRVRTGLLTA